MWRRKDRWLSRSTTDLSMVIDEFWDGAKCKDLQEFWNPASTFELPVICERCRHSYKAWPSTYAAEELSLNWTKDQQMYAFTCKSCRRLIRSAKRTVKAHGTAKKENAGTIALKGSIVETASSIELVEVSPKLCDDVGEETHVDCMPLAVQNQAEGTSRLIGSLKMRQDLLFMWKNTESIESSLQEQEFQFEDLNLDNMDGSFPSFGPLLSNGNVKRVKAMPEQRESLLSDMTLKLGYETVDSVSLSYQANNHEASRKSTRQRKISAKLKESLDTKLGKETSKKIKKKTKDKKCIAGDTSNVYVPKFDEVSSLNVEDEETILLKYFERSSFIRTQEMVAENHHL
ncbi:hypothetical protein GOP47_0015621 [Adiantum capillus-veneris]|uniref:Uncharacterized protein n=1 Tax=Adiantum capillus-veneris TaxID=13818 RepID=A0A9D4UK43_ADICA|nr:hypothetical protein GOP47_0015621 [Adiantum capillus-veneris]